MKARRTTQRIAGKKTVEEGEPMFICKGCHQKFPADSGNETAIGTYCDDCLEGKSIS
jgi:hypothetical protein